MKPAIKAWFWTIPFLMASYLAQRREEVRPSGSLSSACTRAPGGTQLKAHIFSPENPEGRRRSVIVLLQGDVDRVTPLDGVKRFCERMRAAGNCCELHVYEG